MPDLSRLGDLYSLRDDVAADLMAYEYLVSPLEPIWTRLPCDPDLQEILQNDADSPFPITYYLQILADDAQQNWLLNELAPDVSLPADASDSARAKAALLQACDREIAELELASVGEFLVENDSEFDIDNLGDAEDAAQLSLVRVIGDVSVNELERDAVTFIGALATSAALLRADPRTPLVEWPKPTTPSIRERTEALQMQLFSQIESHNLTYRLKGYDSVIAELNFSQMTIQPPALETLELLRRGLTIALSNVGVDADVDEAIDAMQVEEQALLAAEPDLAALRNLAGIVESHAAPNAACAFLRMTVPAAVPPEHRELFTETLRLLGQADEAVALLDYQVRRYTVIVNAAIEYYVQEHELNTGQRSRADIGRPQAAEVLEQRDQGAFDTDLARRSSGGMELS